MFIPTNNFILFFLRARLKFSQEYKYLIKSPKWLFMFVFGRFIFIRFISYFYKHPAMEKYRNQPFLFDLNVEDVVQSLKKDGLCLGINLNENTIKEIREFAERTNFYANGDRNLIFNISEIERHNNNFIIADYLDGAKLCPTISKLASDAIFASLQRNFSCSMVHNRQRGIRKLLCQTLVSIATTVMQT